MFYGTLLVFVIAAGVTNAGLINGLVDSVLDLEKVERLGITEQEFSAFLSFKINFSREYSSEKDELLSLLTFAANLNVINIQNTKFKNGESKYESSVNNFTDIPHREFITTHTGYIATVKARSIHDVEYPPTKIPEYLNYVDKGLVTRVMYQGYCGACWAFSVTGALEAQLAKKTGKLMKLSEQNLIDCNLDQDYGNWGCGGGNMQTTFNFIKQQGGINPFNTYPYRGRGSYPCRYDPNRNVGNIVDFVEVPSGNETALLLALINAGPIALAIDASEPSFQSYSQGIYDHPKCSKDPNHAVLLIGFGTDPKLGPYWILKNSWGRGWGENGYFRLHRNNRNSCGIAVDPSYPVV